MNLKNLTWKSFWKHFSSWKNVSLFEKAFLVSAVITCAMFFIVSVPSQTATLPGPFSEMHPLLESAFLAWIIPLGMFGLWLLKMDLYPGSEDTRLWGGIWTLAFANTFFWAFVLWFVVRMVKLIKSKITTLKKK